MELFIGDHIMYMFGNLDIILDRHLKDPSISASIMSASRGVNDTPLNALTAILGIADVVKTLSVSDQNTCVSLIFPIICKKMCNLRNYSADYKGLTLVPTKHEMLPDCLGLTKDNYWRLLTDYVNILHVDVTDVKRYDKDRDLNRIIYHAVMLLSTLDVYKCSANVLVHRFKDALDELEYRKHDIQYITEAIITYGIHCSSTSFLMRHHPKKIIPKLSKVLEYYCDHYENYSMPHEGRVIFDKRMEDKGKYLCASIEWARCISNIDDALSEHLLSVESTMYLIVDLLRHLPAERLLLTLVPDRQDYANNEYIVEELCTNLVKRMIMVATNRNMCDYANDRTSIFYSKENIQ